VWVVGGVKWGGLVLVLILCLYVDACVGGVEVIELVIYMFRVLTSSNFLFLGLIPPCLKSKFEE